MSNVSSPNITSFSGLASGIDTSSIISKMQAFALQPVTQLTTVSTGLNSQLTAYQSFNANLAAVQSAASTLALPTTFTANTVTSSNTAVATITASAGALTGNHTVTVNTLAQAQEIVSQQYGSSNLGLGQTGTFTVNGHAINVASSDSLSSIASKINSANTGVTASIANVGANTYQLTLSSNKSGVAATISAVDTTGTVLSSLGLLNGTVGIRQAVGSTGAASITTSSVTNPLGSTFGYTTGSAPSGTVTISNGQSGVNNSANISIDLNTDSLSTIASKINAAGITGVSAQIVALPDALGNVGGGGQQLVITGAAKASDYTDSNNVLGTLGILQTSTTGANQPLAAQDANFTYDNLTYTRATNTIGDLIPGATVTLLQQTPSGPTATPATTTLSVAPNTTSIISAVQNFTTAYNNVVDFVTTQNTFTQPTGDNTGTADPSPPLFGSQVLNEVENQLNNAIGVNSGSTTLQSIGITLDPTTGHLNVDTTTLTNALQTNATSVQNLFGIIGNPTNSNVQYAGAGAKTQASSGSGYSVNITTPGAQSTANATVAQTAASTQPETLSFTGLNFNGPVSITLAPNNTLQDTVNQINGDSQLNSLVSATIDPNGKLLLSSTAYGSLTGFSVTSNLAAANNTSGIGLSPVYVTGTDVAGTIDGETAIGHGQTLTGAGGNKNTDGLALTITATSPGSYGSVDVTQGIGTQLGTLLNGILDPTTGEIAGAETALNTQITNNEQQITAINAEVATQTTYLQTTFSNMETQISQLQSQGSAFAAIAAGLSGSTPAAAPATTPSVA